MAAESGDFVLTKCIRLSLNFELTPHKRAEITRPLFNVSSYGDNQYN